MTGTRLRILILFCCLIALPSAVALADQSASAPQPAEEEMLQGGLKIVDWAIIILYGLSTLGLGWYFSRKQQTTEEYFVGSGHMNPFLIGVSLFATLLSTITYLSVPGEVLGKGPVYMTTFLAFPLIYLIVAYGLLPVYMKQRVTSAYELLEVKLDLSIRLLGATMFILLRLVWMSLLVYLAAKAMIVMLNLDQSWIPTIVLVTGFIAVVYTSLGGLQAVVITDFLQSVLLLGGALLVVATVTLDFGGFDWFPTTWQDTWDTQPLFSFDPQTRVTVVGTIVTVLVWYVCTSGGDQTSVQRFMATRDASAARKALATQLLVALVVMVTLGIVGFALLGYFQANLDQLPASMDLKQNADDVYPHYIAYHLPVGVSGLVVAAMFAAAMSSIDSGVNSITAVTLTDFLDRFGKRPKTEKGHMLMARILAFSIGAVVVIGSSYMERVPGNITAVTQKTTNLLVTPIFGLFFFALFVPFARPAGVWVGAIFGTFTAAVTAFSGPLVTWLATEYGVDAGLFGVSLTKTVDPTTGVEALTAPDPISFQWIAPVALIANIATGTLACLLLPKKKDAGNNETA